MIVRNIASRRTELLVQYYRNLSIPCLPRERSTCTFGSIVGLVRTACSFRCALSNSRSSLVMLVSGRDIFHDRSTACARDAYCKTFFPRENLARRARDTVCAEILKQEESVLKCGIMFA